MNIREEYQMFAPRVAKGGYELIHQDNQVLYVKLRNRLKVEIRYKKNYGPIILAAWNHPQIEIIKEWFLDNGYNEPEVTHNLKVSVNTRFQDIENFLKICERLEDIDGLVAIQRGRPIDKETYYMDVAKLIRFTVKDLNGNTGLLDRGMFDKVDSLISVNQPLSENSYREHVVPCTMILNEAFDMVENDSSDEQVAKMIEKNLKIVHITKDQAKVLDQDLGLKTTMPAGWQFGDNVFARLDVANIDYSAATLCRTESA